MTRKSITEVRHKLSLIAKRVARHGERVVVERRGKNLFALVPMEDVELLERIEDETDIRLARKAMKEKGPNIPWEKVKKDLGL